MAYASKYYDPQKAHEYYMQHRKLKGKTRSRSQLTDEGKEALDYVKEQLKAERDRIREQAQKSMQVQIDRLKAAISKGNLSDAEKVKLRNTIKTLRSVYKQIKQATANNYKKNLEAETDKIYASHTKSKKSKK